MADRFLLDSMIHDKLVDEPDLLVLASRLVSEGMIEMLSTHVQADEIARTPGLERVRQLMTVPAKKVPTSGIVFGVSRFGEARFAETEPYETLQGGNVAHSEDALIASTAQYEDATLVTDDRRLASRARKQGIAVVGWIEFRASLLTRDS
jgi:hypothetical protein